MADPTFPADNPQMSDDFAAVYEASAHRITGPVSNTALDIFGVGPDTPNRATLCLVVLCSFACQVAAGQINALNSGSWSGTIVYSSCNPDEAFAESPECSRAAPGAKFSLYDDTSRVIYSLEPQQIIVGHLGDSVTVHGTLDDATIHIASIELMSIGLAVGQKAPAFAARDQFGRVQTFDTLKGSKGTVLLFFRSADW
jgi:hypothetical protein